MEDSQQILNIRETFSNQIHTNHQGSFQEKTGVQTQIQDKSMTSWSPVSPHGCTKSGTCLSRRQSQSGGAYHRPTGRSIIPQMMDCSHNYSSLPYNQFEGNYHPELCHLKPVGESSDPTQKQPRRLDLCYFIRWK